ncbi:LysE family transporter [Streptomyces sp. NPDC086777]|uniref:LysE family transporter n=1 Tax=Streptomyces sp. NPDC086777 TaxID=3154866 RepID=UPI003450DA97
MPWSSLIALLTVWLLALASPGPDFLAVTHAAMARSRRDAKWVGLGVTSANTLWIFGSLAGVTVLLTRVQVVYETIRIAGALYLLYLSFQMLRSIRRRGESVPAAAVVKAEPRSRAAAWRVGALTNLGNPKVAVFFTSVFAAILPADLGWGQRIAAGLSLAVMAAAWFSVVLARVFSLPKIAAGYHRARRYIDGVTGVVLAGLAVRIGIEG